VIQHFYNRCAYLPCTKNRHLVHTFLLEIDYWKLHNCILTNLARNRYLTITPGRTALNADTLDISYITVMPVT
jgi:hypothetical protein